MISLPFAAGDAASAVYAARPKYAAHCAELPFIIIQLPQWIDRATAEAHADPLDWPVIRDAQWAASREIPSIATVCTIDCGEFDNIHPYDKRTVGERTAAMALGTMYRCREIAVCGPEPLAIRAVDGSADYSADGCAGGCAGGGDGGGDGSDGSSDDSERGGAVLVRYRHAAGLRFDGTVPGTTNADGLDAVSRSAEQSGFELADGVFHDAAARIVPDCAVHGGKTGLFSEPGTAGSAASGTTGDTAGEGDGVIRVFSTDVPQPVAIRYAWKAGVLRSCAMPTGCQTSPSAPTYRKPRLGASGGCLPFPSDASTLFRCTRNATSVCDSGLFWQSCRGAMSIMP